MNIEKVKNIVNVINNITETMSLYANVAMDNSHSVVLDDKGTRVVISYLNPDKKPKISTIPQILTYFNKYNSNIAEIALKIDELSNLSNGGHTFLRNQTAELLCEYLNDCQKLKLKTIQIKNNRRKGGAI